MQKSLGARLRTLRGALSQTEFSSKIGVKQTSYSGWEADLKVPAATTVAQIANAIGVSTDWILGLSEDRAGSVECASCAASAERIAELEREVERLKAENAGMKYALDAMGGRSTRAPVRDSSGAAGA